MKFPRPVFITLAILVAKAVISAPVPFPKELEAIGYLLEQVRSGNFVSDMPSQHADMSAAWKEFLRTDGVREIEQQ